MKKIERAEAKAEGLRTYFTDEPCTHGHIAPRLTRNKECIACRKERLRAWRARKRVQSVQSPQTASTPNISGFLVNELSYYPLALELKAKHNTLELQLMISNSIVEAEGYWDIPHTPLVLACLLAIDLRCTEEIYGTG
jgi:hypothetical protein